MKTMYFLVASVLFSFNVNALTLNVGAICNGESSDKSIEENNAASVITEYFTSQNKNIYECIGWIKPGVNSNWFFVNGNLNIHEFNLSTKKHTGPWPLTRWPYLENIIEITTALKDIGHREIDTKIHYTAHRPFAGCTNSTPLRYGDIENDGVNELVLTLNGLLIVFSPQNTRTVFAEWFDASDWYREPIEGSISKSDIDDKRYQYISETFAINGYTHKAFRAYSKLYVGDYDGNGHSDIVVWRKVYASNTQENTTPGFTLIRSSWRHFERNLVAQAKLPAGVTGEYLPQPTDAATIQTWLADNNLTWQKGYPSISECPGQEGKLIPEMHDPLLNDPDVLK